MVKKVKDPLEEAYRLAFEKTRRAMQRKLRRVTGVRIDYPSTRGDTLELRIGFETYEGWGYIDLRIWFQKDDEWLPTRRGVSMSPYYVLAGVIQALKRVRTGKEFWIQKGRRPGARGRDVIRIALELVGSDEVVDQVVDVQLLTLKAGGYEHTEKSLSIPLDLLPRVIDALDDFARAVGEVNRKYLRLRRLITVLDRY